MKKIFLIFLGTLALFGCSNNDDEYVKIPTNINFINPSNFPDIAYDLSKNPLTEEGVVLGKELFYEGKLSSSNIVSCGFCHEQKSAFTHHGHTVSHGVNSAVGFRNAQPIQNLAYFTEQS